MYKAVGKNVVVEVIDQKMSKGGVVFADSSVQSPYTGRVLSVGEHVTNAVNVDETIKFSGFARVHLDDNIFAIHQDDVHAKVS